MHISCHRNSGYRPTTPDPSLSLALHTSIIKRGRATTGLSVGMRRERVPPQRIKMKIKIKITIISSVYRIQGDFGKK